VDFLLVVVGQEDTDLILEFVIFSVAPGIDVDGEVVDFLDGGEMK